MGHAVTALIIVGVTLVLMICQTFPLIATVMLSAFAMGFAGVLEFSDILAQFGTSAFFCVPGMMVVGGAMFETGLAQYIGNGIMKWGRNSEKLFICLLICVVTLMSGFLSNTTCTAMFLPIADMASRSTNGRISRKRTYMGIGIGATLGGCATLVGSPSQHSMAQVLLETNGFELMPFFYGTLATLPMLAIVIVYYLTFGLKIADKHFGPEDSAFLASIPSGSACDSAQSKFTLKMATSGVILLAVIVLIASGVMSSGSAALMGAVAVVLFRVVAPDEAIKSINLTVCIILGGLLAVTEGFNNSGAGELVVDFVINIIGENGSGFLAFALIMLAAMVLTNVLDNIAAQALLGSICISLAVHYGMNPRTMAFALLFACNLAYGTPVGTPSLAMTLSAGYNFRDYLKLGGPLCIIGWLFTITVIPLIYGL